MKFLLILLLFLINLTNGNVNTTDVYDYSAVLVKPDIYYLFWNYTSDSIIAEIHVKTYGWVSFGITIDGNIDRSDLFIAWVNNDKTSKFIDCNIKDNEVFVDTIQNWFLIKAIQSNGYTIIKFQRKLYLCDTDPNEDLNIESGTPYVSFSWDQDDPSKLINYFNSNLNVQPVPLLSSVKKSVKSEINTVSVFTTSSVLLNDQTKTFKCSFFNFATNWNGSNYGTIKRHLTKFETILEPSNEDFIYDWVLYECPFGFKIPTLSNDLTCSLADNNDWVGILTTQCTKPILMWTKGNFLEQEFPAGIGYPFGGSISTPSTYVIRLHYENPDYERNINDTISFKFTFTTDLRANEAGSLAVGIKDSLTGLVLPPGTQEITLNSYCLSNCMNLMLPNFTYLTIFANTPHTYYYGTQINTRLIRANNEYSYIGRNKYYNNNYQYSMFLQKPIILKRGDQLITTCKYNTSDITSFLFGSVDETCLSILYYYPRNPSISFCYTQPSLSEWNNFFVSLNKSGIIYEGTLAINQSLFELNGTVAQRIISQIVSDNSVINKFQSFYDTSNITQFCGISSTNTISPQIKVSSTLEDEKQCPNGATSSIKLNFLFFLLFIKFFFQFLIQI